MNKPRVVTRHFNRDIILVFLFFSIAVIGAVAYFTAKAQRDISQKYIDDAALRAVDAFQVMADAISRDLKLIRDWGAAGKLSMTDNTGLNGLLFPIVKHNPILFGLSVANTDGESYYVADVGNGWRTSRTGIFNKGRQTIRQVWDTDRQMISEEKSQTEYDPRQRPWFFRALPANSVFWTPPYRFYNREDVGITASIAIGEESGKKRFVVAADILLDELFREIQRIGPSKNSRVFILKRDDQLYIPESDNASPDFKSIKEVKDQVINKMVSSWSSDLQSTGEAFAVRHDNETWWYGFRAIEVTNRNIWIGVMVPKSDIIGGISQRQAGLWSVGLFVVAFAGGLVFWLIRRYANPAVKSEDRFDSRHPEESVNRLIARGEGRTIEFKSTMRMNLHTRKPGKEIEIAWLKAVAAFMNTDGGTLLLGVADDGRITGLEEDVFENNDKCRLHFKNLINQNIGVEFSKYLRFTIIHLDNKSIGVAECGRSTDPAFLKTGRKEAFYIRSGPSSEELPVSKVVTYIQNRD